MVCPVLNPSHVRRRQVPDMIDWSEVMAILDMVACGGVRLPEIRRPRCFTPLATGGLVHLRGEGDVRRLMLHSRFE